MVGDRDEVHPPGFGRPVDRHRIGIAITTPQKRQVVVVAGMPRVDVQVRAHCENSLAEDGLVGVRRVHGAQVHGCVHSARCEVRVHSARHSWTLHLARPCTRAPVHPCTTRRAPIPRAAPARDRCARRGAPAASRRRADRRQHQRGRDQRRRIARLEPIEQSRDEPRRPQRGRNPDDRRGRPGSPRGAARARTTPPGAAPSAMRMPISVRRRLTA